MLKNQMNWRAIPVAVAISAIACSAFAAPGPMRGAPAPAFHPSAPAFHPSAPAFHPSAPAFHPSAPAFHPSAPVYHPSPSAPAFHPPMSHAPAYTPPAPVFRAPPTVVRTPPSVIAPAPSRPPVVANGGYRPNVGPVIRPESRPVLGPIARPAYAPPAGTVINRGSSSVHYGPNNSVTVYHGNQVHYTQNVVVVNNNSVIQRTYQGYGGPVVRNYMPYSWGGGPYAVVVYAYQPRYAFEPGYYEWCQSPWAYPRGYGWNWNRAEWGWNNSGWDSYYGYYYQPYREYIGPSYWVTDWLIADMLREEFEERREEARERAEERREGRQRYIDEEVKEQIKLQVEEAMRAHQNQQPVPVTTYLTDTRHVFAISQGLNVTLNSSGEACSLTNGDLIRLADAVQEGDQTANMTVVSSKIGSCPAGAVVTISVTDLQEFQNDFNQRVESGMNHMKTEFSQ